jgi:amino acid permease
MQCVTLLTSYKALTGKTIGCNVDDTATTAEQRLLPVSLLLVIVLILLLVGALPNFGYHSYGYAPSGLVGVLLIILLILLLTGRL